VAWNTALLRPDRVRGVIGLSVPYQPRGGTRPIAALRAALGDGFYMCYFQEPGVADAELAADPPATFRRLLVASSGDGPVSGPPIVPTGGGFLDLCPEPAALPVWLSEHDIGVFADEYAEAGFTGPLNWYRNLDRNWELMAAWHRAPVTVPSMYLAGDRDLVVAGLGGQAVLGRMARVAPGLRRAALLPGCGHWTQQERPAEVSATMIAFLSDLGD
jgi:pimeloyl-ACP methyl ester carboxylesterase